MKQQKQQKKAKAKKDKLNETAVTQTSDEQAPDVAKKAENEVQTKKNKQPEAKPKLDEQTFLTYKEIQKNIINDILSDDEDPINDMNDNQGMQISQNLNSLLDSSDEDEDNYDEEDNNQFSIFDLNKF